MINAKLSTTSKQVVLFIFLAALAVLFLYPIFFMIISASHKSGDILAYPPPSSWGDYFSINYQNLLVRIPIWQALFNSFKLAVAFTFLNLLCCSMAGYALAKFNFKYKNLVFMLILITMMFPSYARLIPLYRMMHLIGLQNTHLAVILPDLAGAFGIFLMRQNFSSIPDSLIESSRIDGANEWAIFVKIVIPLVVPALSALGIYMFMAQWSNFTWPLIILNEDHLYTLPVLLSQLKGDTRIDYGQIMVGALFTVIPILIAFLFFQKYFISGLTSGAVKE